MEGKSGLNIVLMIVAILAVVAGVVLCILFGIGVQLGENMSIVSNLYVGLGCLGFGLLMLIGCNIAVNSRITADNSYDAMRYVEMLCKREGFSHEDLVRNDAKVAEKKVVMEAKEKLKQEKEAREQAEAAAAEANEQLRVARESNAQAQVQINEMQEKLNQQATVVSEENNAQPKEEAASDKPAEAVEQVAATTTVALNCGIDADEWKNVLKDKGTCATCGEAVSARTNKSGRVGLVCKNNGTDKCTEKPMFIEDFAAKFVAWYNESFDDHLDAFSMDAFVATVDKYQLKEGDIIFIAKSGETA